ncbi:MAG: cell division protein FtsZ, partial [Rhodobacteraceae bacterium]|nr:cell division protein FtsZ [Paracoccaceae bacterium]
SGEDRAIQAAEKAIANPLLDEISLKGARGVLINITGGHDLTLFELDEAANRIREEVDQDANIIVGSTLDTAMDGMMRVSVVATGIDASDIVHETPVPRRPMSAPLQPKTIAAEAPAAPAPSRRPEPVAREYEEDDQPDFLSGLDEAAEDVSSLFDDPMPEMESDDLPAPVYQPERRPMAQPQARAEAYQDFPDPDVRAFVAPKAPAPGRPSAETMARLKHAIEKQPKPRDHAPAAGRPAAQPEKKGGFGINTLINRMTGHAAEPPQREEPQRVHPRANLGESRTHDPDQERIDIPAFLRRQAN